MSKQKLAANTIYHLYNRGVNFKNIFYEQRNWAFFLMRLNQYLKPAYGSLIAYCLMPNHYHLLIQTIEEDFGNLVMHPLGTSYTKAINKQEGRVGTMFQGPFQARPVQSNADLLNLSRYIHRNPQAAGFVDSARDWDFSSYRAYINEGDVEFVPKLPCLHPAQVLDQFESRASYAAFVEEKHITELDAKMVFD